MCLVCFVCLCLVRSVCLVLSSFRVCVLSFWQMVFFKRMVTSQDYVFDSTLIDGVYLRACVRACVCSFVHSFRVVVAAAVWCVCVESARPYHTIPPVVRRVRVPVP